MNEIDPTLWTPLEPPRDILAEFRAWAKEIEERSRIPMMTVGICSMREMEAAEREGRAPIPYCYESVPADAWREANEARRQEPKP